MQKYTLDQARHELNKLLKDARKGEVVFILDDQNQAVQLVPIASAAVPRKAGSARGKIKMAPDFDALLDDFAEYSE